MKNIATIIIAFAFSFGANTLLSAQDVDSKLTDAQSSYKSGNLQDARFAMQQALAEIDKAIGAEILLLFPDKMGPFPAVAGQDNVTGTGTGFAGLFVSRSYKNEDEAGVSLQVIGDSPMLAGINTLLTLPMFGTDPNMKKIKVGSYRAILQKSTSDTGVISWDVQVPFGSSLLTLNCQGVNDEKTVVEMANTIPLEKISKFVQ